MKIKNDYFHINISFFVDWKYVFMSFFEFSKMECVSQRIPIQITT